MEMVPVVNTGKKAKTVFTIGEHTKGGGPAKEVPASGCVTRLFCTPGGFTGEFLINQWQRIENRKNIDAGQDFLRRFQVASLG